MSFLIRQQEYNCFVIMFPHLLFFFGHYQIVPQKDCMSLCSVWQDHCSASSLCRIVSDFGIFVALAGVRWRFFVVSVSWPWWSFAQDIWISWGRNVAVFKKFVYESLFEPNGQHVPENKVSIALRNFVIESFYLRMCFV